MADRFGYDEIQRPAYCGCEAPWQTPTGPLKDGSHYSDCVAPDVAEDMAGLKAEVRARTALLRRLAENGYPADGETGDCVLCGAVGKPMGVTLAVADDDHADNCVWALARAAITDPTPQTEPCRCPNHIAHDAFCTERCICWPER